MKILLEDVSDFVKQTILNIRQGMQDARDQGIVFDGLPKEVQFQLEIIKDPQSLESVTETVESESGDETTSEDAVTDTEDVTRTATDETTEGGQDIDVSVLDWEFYDDE